MTIELSPEMRTSLTMLALTLIVLPFVVNHNRLTFRVVGYYGLLGGVAVTVLAFFAKTPEGRNEGLKNAVVCFLIAALFYFRLGPFSRGPFT